jgi:hypothetical protein
MVYIVGGVVFPEFPPQAVKQSSVIPNHTIPDDFTCPPLHALPFRYRHSDINELSRDLSNDLSAEPDHV